MLSVDEQIDRGIVVCPRTHARLIREKDGLVAPSAGSRYPILNSVPILCSDPARLQSYLDENAGKMHREYSEQANEPKKPRRPNLTERFEGWVGKLESKMYRWKPALAAWEAVARFQERPEAVCISIGGGPERNAEFLNLNIGPYPNVDIVADAYELPYADNSVDAVCCAAVLEHLEFPDKAVSEAARVLKPGGEAFFETPFLQPYHGYPNHFQNFTLSGQERLLLRHGLAIVSSGVSVGPSHVFYHIVTSWFFLFSKKKWLRLALSAALAKLMKPWDRTINDSPDAHVLGSTTYVHGRKP